MAKASILIRTTPALKELCIQQADQAGLSLNKWIMFTLEDACEDKRPDQGIEEPILDTSISEETKEKQNTPPPKNNTYVGELTEEQMEFRKRMMGKK